MPIIIVGQKPLVPMTGGPPADNELAGKIIAELFQRCRELGASGTQTMNIVMIGIVGEMLANNTQSEEEQDLYLKWFVGGVEALLKGNGRRRNAAPNPLARN